MKKLKVGFTAFCLFLVFLASAAAWEPIGNVSGVKPLPNGMELSAGRGLVRIVALSPSVVRVRYAPDGQYPIADVFAVVADTGFHAPAVQVKDGPDSVEFSTSAFTVRVAKTGTRVAFYDPSNRLISQDDPDHPVAWNGKEFRVWKSMPEEEHYFGLGDKAGPIDHRDQAFTMWNTDAVGWERGSDPLYKSIPFFMGVRDGRAYGIFLDNTFRSNFDFGKELRDAFSFGADGGGLDYYFFYGPDPKKVVEDYTALTGRTPLPPLFALGYQQSRYSYYPEARVRQIANEFRARKIPCDVIFLDIDYEDGYRSFTVDHKRFPTFAGMIHDLGQEGFKIVTIVDLHMKKEKGYRPYDEGVAGDHFVKNPDGSEYVGKVWPGASVFPDFTQRAAREWFGTLYADFVKIGVRGFWNDMNEPSVFVYPSKTMPLDTVHRVTEGDAPNAPERKTDHREVHNVFGMENVRSTYEGLLRLLPDVRPFVLTRAAFAGTQRYAATWTGDNQSYWTHLQLSVPTLLSLGISGYAFIGDDIGGFAGSPPADLLTRWIELGAFNPFYRNHTDKGSRNQEPWVNGPVHEAIRRRYIETRYRLLPYIYTAMEETSRTGVPLMRPMFMEFPGDARLATNDAEFMFGADLLVAPKLRETLDPYDVVLPAGTWFDYWTGKSVKGGGTIKVDPPLGVLPVYVRGGAIVPQQPLVQDTDQVPQGPLELRVYPGPDCHGSTYADDGKTFAYQRGQFSRTSFTCEMKSGAVRVGVSAPEGPFRPWWNDYRVVVFGAQAAPRQVSVGAKTFTAWKYDPVAHTVSLTVPVSRTAMDVMIQYRTPAR